jgi:hypothetical protein
MAILNNDTLKAQKLYEVYKRNNFNAMPAPSGQVIAKIQNVGIDKNISHTFSLSRSTPVKYWV